MTSILVIVLGESSANNIPPIMPTNNTSLIMADTLAAAECLWEPQLLLTGLALIDRSRAGLAGVVGVIASRVENRRTRSSNRTGRFPASGSRKRLTMFRVTPPATSEH